MLRRLLVTLLVFATLAVCGFGIPLGISRATARTQQLWLSRYTDAEWFAELADKAMESGDRRALLAEILRYHELYGDRILVVDAGGAEFANIGVDPRARENTALLADVRSNRRISKPPPRLRPWDRDVLRVTHPIGVGLQVQGAVLIETSTAQTKRDITDDWALIAAGMSTALALFTLVAMALSRWVLRPLAKLSNSVRALTETLPKPVDPPEQPSAQQRYAGPPEIRDLTRSFDTMKQAVSDAVDAQRRLVADTAHAIRNPLTALAIRLDSLGRALPEDKKVSFVRVGDQVEKLESVLDGLLKLAAAETPAGFGSAQHDPDWPQTCTAIRIVEDRVEAWQPAFSEAGMTLTAQSCQVEDEFAIPPATLMQILDVLLSNSCRYAGTEAHTEIQLRTDGRWGLVSVKDDGVGVAADEITKLTTRFYRSSAAVAGGTGLGLSIAAALAQRHQGTLELNAVVPHGLEVTVRFPLHP